MIYVAIMKCSNDYYLCMNNDNTILGANEPEPIIRIFERAYNEAHDRSYEGSMSACIAYISAQPAIVELNDLTEISKIVIISDEGTVNGALVGGCKGALCRPEIAKELWSKGKNPRLISCD